MIQKLVLWSIVAMAMAMATVGLAGSASALLIDTFDDTAAATANTGNPNVQATTPTGSFLGTNRVLSGTE